MNRLIGVLFLIAACAPITAQDNKQSNAPAEPSVQASRKAQAEQSAPAKPTFLFEPTFKFPTEFPQNKTGPPRGAQLILIGPPEFVIVGRALYLDVLGNGTLVPVPGGGASGCFNWNLHERMGKLKTTIEAFPPRPQSTTPRR